MAREQENESIKREPEFVLVSIDKWLTTLNAFFISKLFGGNRLHDTEYAGYETWKQWSAESFGQFDRQQAAYYRAEILRTGLECEPGMCVLEIGFGNGDFAGWARSQGFNYTGIELISELVVRASANGIRAFGSDDDLVTEIGLESVDLVVTFDVLEHLELEEIQATLESVWPLLRQGGFLLARMPSGDSPFGRSIFHGDLTHRITFGSSAVEQLASRCGYSLLLVDEPKFPVFRVGLVSGIRRSFAIAARYLTSLFINTVFHDNQPKVITANMVFVLRKENG